MSSAGQNFIVGKDAKVPNDGQASSNLQTGVDLLNDITSTFRVARVSTPFISVGNLCDVGMEANFKKTRADVVAPSGDVVCTFKRHPGGLYCQGRGWQLSTPDMPEGSAF